jgi:hypothetical protein
MNTDERRLNKMFIGVYLRSSAAHERFFHRLVAPAVSPANREV